MIKKMKTYILVIIGLFISIFEIKAQANEPTVRNISTQHSGITVRGQYGIYFKTNGLNQNRLTKPIIICEGFDPLNDMGFEESYRQVNGGEQNGANSIGLLDRLRSRGYDIVVLNLHQNTEAINRNASLFIRLMEIINEELQSNNSLHQSTVIGISMGGLITKLALARMERDGQEHRVENYISFDSPHRGANIPLGLQHFADYFLSPVLISAEVTNRLDQIGANPLHMINNRLGNPINSSLASTAAQEMSAIYMRDNPVRRTFLNQLNNVGNYPQNCRKIAVASGMNGTGQNEEFSIGAGSNILRWVHDSGFLINQTIGTPLGDIGVRWKPFDWRFRSFALPGNSSNNVFTSKIEIQPGINLPSISRSTSRSNGARDHSVAPSSINIDHVPGGWFEFPHLMDFANDLNRGNLRANFNLSYTYTIMIPEIRLFRAIITPAQIHTRSINYTFDEPWRNFIGQIHSDTDLKFTFVPTLSALDINNNNWFYNIANTNHYPYPKDKSLTPFDAIVVNETKNRYHAFLLERQMADFLLQEINPNNLYVQNKSFNNGSKNSFQANTITVGANVDVIEGRSEIGDVIIRNGSQINFSVPPSGSIVLKPGFRTNGGTIRAFVDTTLPEFRNESFSGGRLASTPEEEELYERKSLFYSDEEFIRPEIPITKKTYYTQNGEIIDLETYRASMDALKKKGTTMYIYPNPIQETTKIQLHLPKNQNIKLSVFDLSGREVLSLKNNEFMKRGIHQLDLNSEALRPGVYIVKLAGNNLFETQRIVK
jgi:hypothetical protein